MSDAAPKAAPSGNKFGTFGGVFTPSILTILGAIMFLRTGYVVGTAGVWGAVGILVLANSITFLTGLSICAISTNTRVRGGGAYFLISRSLGPGYGGAIGLALFLAQAFSVPFYILAFVEALVATFPGMAPLFMPIGLGTLTALFVVNWIGSEYAIRAQYGILCVLVSAVFVMLGGAGDGFEAATFQANAAHAFTGDVGFWAMFAIFFPAVTGIMTGVNMSGDLRDPSVSIPRGTLAAIAVGFVVYLAQILLTGGSTPRQTLIDAPYESLMAQAMFNAGPLIVAGVCAATLSSALGSLMGAPRILQALAKDDIFGFLGPFAKGTARGDEPRRGLAATYALSVLVLVVAGNGSGGAALNAVASLLTMFFLYTYGMTNMAAFVEKASGNPSFRPRFRFFHPITALLGALGCVFAAILIDPIGAGVAFAVVLGIFASVERRVLSTTFGDARRGYVYSRVRSNLFKLDEHDPHPKNWRPTALVLSGNPRSRLTLTTYAIWLESGRGIATLAQILVGQLDALLPKRAEAVRELEAYIRDNRLEAFGEVIVARELDEGIATLLQAHSIGPLKPNLVVSGWPGDADRADAFARHVNLSLRLGMSHVAVLDRGLPPPVTAKRIDVWWRGQTNGSLMIILAWLVSLNWEWGRSRVRILRAVEPGADTASARRDLRALVEAARMSGDIEVVETADLKTTLHAESTDADVVFLGFSPAGGEDPTAWYARYASMTEGLPTTLLVASTGDADVFA